jgi:hypothetical protein
MSGLPKIKIPFWYAAPLADRFFQSFSKEVL